MHTMHTFIAPLWSQVAMLASQARQSINTKYGDMFQAFQSMDLDHSGTVSIDEVLGQIG